jgi:hypothetical protein
MLSYASYADYESPLNSKAALSNKKTGNKNQNDNLLNEIKCTSGSVLPSKRKNKHYR